MFVLTPQYVLGQRLRDLTRPFSYGFKQDSCNIYYAVPRVATQVVKSLYVALMF